ncbi:MAG: hypothetical protein WCR23_13910 [Planctomycetota bacterium]
MNELEAYRANIEKLADLESKEVFGNGKAEHAMVIFETFFKRAKENIVIFCKDLSEKVFNSDNLISLAEDALRRKARVTILTQSDPKSDKFVAACSRWKEEKLPITMRVSKPGSSASSTTANFAVMDRKAYRFEPNREEKTAFACMNNESACATLLGVFSRLELEQPA